MQLLRTILIILLVYYAIKILTKLFAPMLMRYASKKMEKKFGEAFKQYQNQEQSGNEGETVIDKNTKNNSKTDKKVGEYIDFEEIEEPK